VTVDDVGFLSRSRSRSRMSARLSLHLLHVQSDMDTFRLNVTRHASHGDGHAGSRMIYFLPPQDALLWTGKSDRILFVPANSNAKNITGLERGLGTSEWLHCFVKCLVWPIFEHLLTRLWTERSCKIYRKLRVCCSFMICSRIWTSKRPGMEASGESSLPSQCLCTWFVCMYVC
jgi:hypothetical protein